MSEAAEELERMAESLELGARGRDRSARGDSDLSKRRRGEASGLREAASALRDRAAGLRAEAKATVETDPIQSQMRPTWPLKKPEFVDIGQWWRFADDPGVHGNPGRVEHMERQWADLITQQGETWSTMWSDLLTNPGWLYLGSDAEPARP